MTTSSPPELMFPAVLWRSGYVFVAQSPSELFSHPKSLFKDTVARARKGEWHLADAGGRCFDIADWYRIDAPGGLKGLALKFMGSVFAAPQLVNETRPDLPEFKRKLAGVIKSRYRHDSGTTPKARAIEALEPAATYEAAIRALPKNWDDSD